MAAVLYFIHVECRMKTVRYPAIALNGNIRGQRPSNCPRKLTRKLKSITDAHPMILTVQMPAHRRSSDIRDWPAILKQKPSRITP